MTRVTSNELGIIDPASLESLGSEELKDWIRDQLQGRVHLTGIRWEPDPPYRAIAQAYSKLRPASREAVQDAVLGLLSEAARGTDEWQEESTRYLLGLSDPVLLQSPRVQNAILLVQKIRESAQDEKFWKLQVRALQALITLGFRGDEDFWTRQYQALGEEALSVICSGVARVGVPGFFSWVSREEWGENLSRAVQGLLPSLLRRHGVDYVVEEFQRALLALKPDAANALQEFFRAHGIAIARDLASALTLPLSSVLSRASSHSSQLSTGRDLAEPEREALKKKLLQGGLPNVYEHVLPLIADLDGPALQKFFEDLERYMRNGHQGEMGTSLGRALAGLPSDRIEKVWRLGVRPAAEMGDQQSRRWSAYVMKGIAEKTFHSNGADSQDFLRTLNKLNRFEGYAERLAEAWDKTRSDIGLIKLLTGPFHEEVLLARILQRVAVACGVRDIAIEPSKWTDLPGDRKDAGYIVLRNIEMLSSDQKDLPPLFEFKGYYVFARREWLRTQYPNLLNVDSLAPSQDLQLAASAAIEGGLAVEQDSDFAFLRDRLRHIRKAKNAAPSSERIDDYEQYFDDFVTGGRNVFMGGAAHAALLRHWWADGASAPVVLLIGPKGFDHVPGTGLPMRNTLVFQGRLRGNRTWTSRLRKALMDLYRAAGLAMYRAASEFTSKQSPDSKRVMHGLGSILIENSAHKGWSFVSSPEDLAYILTNDDNFSITNGLRPVPPRRHGSFEVSGRTLPRPRGQRLG